MSPIGWLLTLFSAAQTKPELIAQDKGRLGRPLGFVVLSRKSFDLRDSRSMARTGESVA